VILSNPEGKNKWLLAKLDEFGGEIATISSGSLPFFWSHFVSWAYPVGTFFKCALNTGGYFGVCKRPLGEFGRAEPSRSTCRDFTFRLNVILALPFTTHVFNTRDTGIQMRIFQAIVLAICLPATASPVMTSAQSAEKPDLSRQPTLYAVGYAHLGDTTEIKNGIDRMQSWYDQTTGLYRTTGWWNSANAITTLANYARATKTHTYDEVFANTFSKAQDAHPGFLNDYYDDEGWWALAWIDVYDLTRQEQYLAMSAAIFEDMASGWDETCGGGIWWSKKRKYKNAIANELFLSVSASLARRARDPRQKAQYLGWSLKEWEWFQRSGMINDDHLINDGLDSRCENNHKTTWTYNQGVILGGLSELYFETQDTGQLNEANTISRAVFSSPTLVDRDAILHDTCEPKCGADGTQFKGIFVRNLGLLYRVKPAVEYRDFVAINSDRILKQMKSPDYSIGERWTDLSGTSNASTQSSGMDAIVTDLAIRQALDLEKRAKQVHGQ
jgi:predicted alpha-1,6-mannanase (GH76 family)